MSFKDRKRDDHGHVIGNDEVDGQKCQHGAGGSKSQDTTNKSKEIKDSYDRGENVDKIHKSLENRLGKDFMNKYSDMNAVPDSVWEEIYDELNPAFDDDYDEEFDDKRYNEEMKKAADENFDMSESENEDNLNPNNPKYKGFDNSHITNAKLVDEGKKVHNLDRNKDETLSIIEYIPYGALKDGDNRKLYGVVSDYDGSDAPDIGAIVSPSLESAREDLDAQIKLAEQGSERYLGRGKYDKEWFEMLNDEIYDWDEDTKKHYAEKYGWDFSKPWEEQAHMREGSSKNKLNNLPIPTDEDKKQIREENKPDKDEMNLINKEKAEREANEAKIKNNAAKFANLMVQGKKEEAWELLNSLSNEEVSLMFEKLGK